MSLSVNFDIKSAGMKNKSDNCVDQILKNDFSKIFDTSKSFKDTYMDKTVQRKDVQVRDENDLKPYDRQEELSKDTKTEIKRVSKEEKIASLKDDKKIEKIEEIEEKIKKAKKKIDVASNEIMSMLIQTLNSDEVEITDYLTITEDSQIVFDLTKMEDLISDMKETFENETGLNFEDIMANLARAIDLNGEDSSNLTNVNNEIKELVAIATNTLQDAINQNIQVDYATNEGNEQIEIANTLEEAENQDLIDAQSENLIASELETSISTLEIKEQKSKSKILEDEDLVKEIKSMLKELVGEDEKNIRMKDENPENETFENTNAGNIDEETINIKFENKEMVKDAKLDDTEEGNDANVTLNNVETPKINYGQQNAVNNQNSNIETLKDNATNTVREDITARFAETIKVVKQTITGVNLKISETTQEMELKLDPENLGKISLKVATDNGIVTAKFEAESQKVKEILESNLSLLKESLTKKGLEISNVEVSVGSNENQGSRDYEFERQANKSKNPHKIPRNSINKFVNTVDNNSRRLLRTRTYSLGNNVNYIA